MDWSKAQADLKVVVDFLLRMARRSASKNAACVYDCSFATFTCLKKPPSRAADHLIPHETEQMHSHLQPQCALLR